MTDEQRAKRVHYHMYETCEGIREHAERIVKLEELCADLYRSLRTADIDWQSIPDFETMEELVKNFNFSETSAFAKRYTHRLKELGIEVER